MSYLLNIYIHTTFDKSTKRKGWYIYRTNKSNTSAKWAGLISTLEVEYPIMPHGTIIYLVFLINYFKQLVVGNEQTMITRKGPIHNACMHAC